MSDKKVIAWKFSQLDTDGDSHLKRREVRNLRRMLKKLVRPKACAKTFITYCDTNRDKKVSMPEWTKCLRVDPRSSRPIGPESKPVSNRGLGFQPRGESWEKKTGLKAHVPGQENDKVRNNKNSTERRGCKAERETALKMDRADPNSKIFIPECTKTEQYKREQCHVATGYCWCVLPSSGKPIPGTATLNVTPQCNRTVLREMKDCSYEMKRMFLQELLDMYTTQLVEYANNNRTDHSKMPAQNPKHSLEEHTVRWRFNILDVNNNKLIDKREKRLLKKDLRNIKPKRKKKALRRCSREFVTFCDSNSNKQITLAEWLECTGVTEQQNTNLPNNPKRKGPNPFKKWLRSSNS